MRYYDSDFRKQLQEMLKTYRGMLTHQITSSNENKNNLPLIESQIKQIDEALQIIKPSLTDILTERKIEKIQKEQFSSARTEEIRQQARKEFEKEIRAAFTKEMETKLRKELKPTIRAEVEKEIADKKSEESFNQVKSQLFSFVKQAFAEQDGGQSPPPKTKNPVAVQRNNDNSYDDMDYDDTDTMPVSMEAD